MPANILPGQLPTSGSGTPWGQVPQVPDPLSTANLAITGDIANLPSLTDLASQVNQFNTGQAIAPYIANLPGYQSMVGQSSQNIGSLLRGEIPTDVMNLLNQQMAERGVASGLAGSPNASAAALRGLGLTSLDLQKQGEGELTAAIGRTPVPQLFNVAQFLTTPGEEQAAQMAANIYAAAPDPNLQAQELMKLFTQFMSQMRGATGVPGTGTPNLTIPDIIPPGGPSTAPPVTVSGGGAPPPTTTQQSFWDWWKQNQPPPGTGGGSTTTGTGGSGGGYMYTGGTGTSLGPPDPNAWTLGGTSPDTTWMNTLFGAPSYQDSSILGMGLDPLLNSLFGTAPPPQTGGAPPGTGYNPFTDQSFNAPWLTEATSPTSYYDFLGGGQTAYQDPNLSASGFSYNPFTDQSTAYYDPNAAPTDPLSNMSSEDMAAYLGLEDWYAGG